MDSPKDIRGWLDRDDILILDTETTGFSGSSEVIEIVMMDTTGLVHLSELSMPVDGIPRAASDVHGLTIDELLRHNAVDWPAIHDLVASVLDDANLVIAWNAGFDRRMLDQTAIRHRKQLPAIKWVDMLPIYRALRPGGRHRLGDAVEREGVMAGVEHRAEADCRAVLEVMRAVADER